jgi:hypothetical protein
MTKVRLPLTPYRALARIAELLGWDGCAAVLGNSEWTVRKWSDPDAEREISFQDAMRLDAAFMRAGGEGAPLYECYAARIDLLARDDGSDSSKLLAAASRAATELAEAVSASIDAAAQGGNQKLCRRAITEAEEGMEALQSLIFSLKRLTPVGG